MTCRLRKDNYKGMSTAETMSIAEDQKAQALAKLQRQKEEAARDLSASQVQDNFTLSWRAQQAEVVLFSYCVINTTSHQPMNFGTLVSSGNFIYNEASSCCFLSRCPNLSLISCV